MKKLLILVPFTILMFQCNDEAVNPENPVDMPYDIQIDPNDFINSNFTGNDFFPLNPGYTYIFEGENEDGNPVVVEEIHTNEIKIILGVTCVVIHAIEYEDGQMTENTFDWYAQDVNGNVWYFGEYSEEIENGEVVSTKGSWESGIDGALPGVIMFADPFPGVWYRQEYYEGEAEDVAQILSLNASITVPFGSFNNCLQTAEWSPLDKGVMEHKFYAPGTGLLSVVVVEGDPGYEELVEIKEN